MPDRDGISEQFADGRRHCHACGGWIIGRRDLAEHRSRCGRRWRRDVRQGRERTAQERQLTLAAIERETGG